MRFVRVSLFLSMLLGASAALAQDEVRRFHGYAYDLESGAYLYTEAYEQVIEGGKWVRGSTQYLGPDGKVIGTKTLDFSADPYIPIYRLDLAYGYSEGISAVGDEVTMTRRKKSGAAEKSETEDREHPMAADAGMPKLLHANFDALLAGKKLEFKLLAPGRLTTYRFKAKRVEDGTFEERPVVRIQVELDSMLNLFAGPLQFSFDAETRDMKEYRGTTNIRNPKNGELYVVRVAYFSKPPADAPSPPAP